MQADSTQDDLWDRFLVLAASSLHNLAVALSTLSKTNAKWLAARRRKRWWRRNVFPKA